MNIHTPERGADETQAAYKLRRSLSRDAVRSMPLRGLGDQRKAPSSRQQLRDSQRANGNGPRASFGPTLMTAYASLRAAALPTACPRDDFGAYTLTGFHGAHVFAGVVMLGVVLYRGMAGQFSAKHHDAVEATSLYWHFVDVVWILLFSLLYLLPGKG